MADKPDLIPLDASDVERHLGRGCVPGVDRDRNPRSIAGQGVDLAASASPAEFTAYIKSDYAKWAKVLDDAGIKPE